MRMMFVACLMFTLGCLFGWWLDYHEVRDGLSETEWAWLRSFYKQLKKGQIKVVEAPEEEEADAEKDPES